MGDWLWTFGEWICYIVVAFLVIFAWILCRISAMSDRRAAKMGWWTERDEE